MRKYTLPILLAALLTVCNTAFIIPGVSTADQAVASAPAEYDVIDTYARRTPAAYAKDIKTLSEYLTSPARSDLAKARSVYAWIVTHVRYDDKAYTGATYTSEYQYADRVLKSRRAVCTGFALLYKYLLSQAGVEVTTVKGYARYADSQAGFPIGEVDHEWNAVKLDGDWYLLDVAWATTTAQNGVANDFYFLTDPQAFVAQHLPVDSRWQLLSRAVTKADFDRFPKYYDAYFKLGFDRFFPRQGAISTTGEIILNFTNQAEVEFWCALGSRGSSSNKAIPHQVRRTDGTYQVRIRVPERKSQTLYIFARDKTGIRSRYKQYAAVASFTLL